MYRSEKYKKDDKQFIFSFIKKNPFATVIMNGNRLMATHLPVLLAGSEDEWLLYTHLANHNEQAALVKEGAEALIIFHGPHSYISSSWYKEKDISTWDYSAVHVNAKLKIQTREELENSLENLVKHFEKEQRSPLYYKDIPRAMLEDHLPLITGFWLDPVKVEGVAKLHQSYPKHDVQAVIDNLNSSGDAMKQELGKAIKKENNISE